MRGKEMEKDFLMSQEAAVCWGKGGGDKDFLKGHEALVVVRGSSS